MNEIELDKICGVLNCTERAHNHGLCKQHEYRWMNCQRPDLGEWLALGGPLPGEWNKRQQHVNQGEVAA